MSFTSKQFKFSLNKAPADLEIEAMHDWYRERWLNSVGVEVADTILVEILKHFSKSSATIAQVHFNICIGVENLPEQSK